MNEKLNRHLKIKLKFRRPGEKNVVCGRSFVTAGQNFGGMIATCHNLLLFVFCPVGQSCAALC